MTVRANVLSAAVQLTQLICQLSLGCGLSLAITLPLRAQTAPPASTPPVSIPSRPTGDSRDLLDPDEEEITVTGKILNQPVFAPFRREAPARESSRPVYVIDRQQIEAQGARTVQEALKYLPGILSDGTAGGQLGALGNQFIRGGNSAQVLILLDGRPVNDVGFFGGFDLSEFTTDNVERIELLPGGGSTLYGSDALGGVINIVTRTAAGKPSGSANKPEVDLRAALGSFSLNEQAVQTRGRTGGLGWSVSYSRLQAINDFPFQIGRINLDSRRDNAQVLYNNFNVKLEGQISPRNQLRFSALYLNKEFGVAGGVPIPGSLGAFNTLTPQAEQRTRSLLLDLGWTAQLDKANNSRLNFRLFTDLLDYDYDNPDLSMFGSRDQVNRRSIGFQGQHNWRFRPNQMMTYGFDYRNTRSRNTTFTYASGLTDVNYDGVIQQGALFARYDVNVTPRLSLNIGLRQDFNSFVNGSFASPSFGVRYSPFRGTTLRANYARSFRAPQVSNLEGLAAFGIVGNPELRPEVGNSFDIGVDQSLGKIGLLRLTLFANYINDLINFRFGSPSTYENIGRVRTLGAEVALNVQLRRDFYAFANYTFNDARILENADPATIGNQLSFRDADALSVGLSYENRRGVYTALILRNVSRFFINNTNTESLPGYTTLDLKFRVPLGKSFAFNGSVDNLLDRQYEQYPGYPGVGRSFRLGFTARF
jgi:vitamin B12 transporter